MTPCRLLPLHSPLSLSSTALAANPLPTDQDLQQMLEKGDYRACLQQTARVLNISGDLGRNYDPFVLQMRRGECLVNLGDNATALAAYTAALHSADDGKKAEQARAMISLIHASRGLVYTPNGGQPINIVPLADRKLAMAALFADSLPTANQALHAALDANVINPILDLFPKIQELHALEMLGTGNDEKTQPMLIAMGDRARDMISSAPRRRRPPRYHRQPRQPARRLRRQHRLHQRPGLVGPRHPHRPLPR